MKISVVIPMYNKASTIHRAIESVLEQSLKPHQLIVIDDGSTDHGAELVATLFAGLSAHIRARCQLVKTRNQGVSAARNTGIGLSQSDHIALLDADDRWQTGHLASLATLIERHPFSSAWVTAYRFVDADGHLVRNARWASTLKDQSMGTFDCYFKYAARGDLPISASSICLNKAIFEQCGGFPIEQAMGEDQWLWSKLALHGNIAYVNSVTSEYFLHSDNSLMDGPAPGHELPYSVMLQKLIDSNYIQDGRKPAVRHYIRTHLYDLVRRNFQQGKTDTVARLLSDSRLHFGQLKFTYWHLRLLLARLN